MQFVAPDFVCLPACQESPRKTEGRHTYADFLAGAS